MNSPFSKIADKIMTFARKENSPPNIELAEPREPIEDNITATLAERGKRYGTFKANSIVYVNLMMVMEMSPNWKSAPPEVKHALGNIATKLARLLTGDVMYYDNWRDIAGYATLMDKICNGEVR